MPHLTAPPTPSPTAPAQLLRWAEQLSDAGLWAAAAPLHRAALHPGSSDDERVEAAWAAVRAQDPRGAKALLAPILGGDARVLLLASAAGALEGDEGSYAGFRAHTATASVTPGMLRLSAMCAVAHHDWVVAASAAKRLLARRGEDADMLVIVAAEAAAHRDWRRAADAAERAGAARAPAAVPPPAEIVDLLLARGCRDEAATLSGYALTASGGTEWRDQLHRVVAGGGLSRHAAARARAAGAAHHRTSRRARDRVPVLAVLGTALVGLAAAAHLPLASGLPGGWLPWTCVVLPAAVGVAVAVARRDRRTAGEPLGLQGEGPLAPGHCVCWEVDLLHGEDSRDYVRDHLVLDRAEPALGLALRRCPATDKGWLDLPASRLALAVEDPEPPAEAPVTYPTGLYL